MLIKKIQFIFFVFASTFFFQTQALAANINTGISLDIFYCNHDTVCDALTGENSTYCLDDCPLPVCNNNSICDNSEDVSNCPADCTVATSTGGGGGGGGGYVPPTTPTSSTSTTPTTTSTSSSTTSVSSTIEIPLSPPPLVSPLFSAFGLDGQVLLRWQKTDENVWKKVIIRRSTLFYPENMTAGGLLYDGLGNTTDNKNFYLYDLKLKNGKRYYYTLFVVDVNGRQTGGVSASALPQSSVTVSSSLEVPKRDLPPETTLPKSPDFFESKPDSFTFINSILEVPLANVPTSTYTAILTVEDGASYNTYILGKTDTGLSTILPPLGSQTKQITITFLNSNHQILSQIKGQINSPITPPTNNLLGQLSLVAKAVIEAIVSTWKFWLGLVLIIIFFLLRFI